MKLEAGPPGRVGRSGGPRGYALPPGGRAAAGGGGGRGGSPRPRGVYCCDIAISLTDPAGGVLSVIACLHPLSTNLLGEFSQYGVAKWFFCLGRLAHSQNSRASPCFVQTQTCGNFLRNCSA